ncbi:hypothetical protein AB0M20_44730, partial [Actinoplanes sp. NPDC051633]|uniref:hypothetical protein n=1 Tax=Actinoplanes sp. NPDC051633 TaxID=3155670 RepID=UPI003414861A
MNTATLDYWIERTRSIGSATSALARAIERGDTDLDRAVDRLEIQARTAVEDSTRGFDAASGAAPSDEERLVGALSQLQIGNALLTAESAIASGDAAGLRSAVASMDRTADAIEVSAAAPALVHSFDIARDGVPLNVLEAAHTALDEMVEGAAGVTTALVTEVIKPLTDRVPEAIKQLGSELLLDLPGRLARWALRAIRGGVNLLLRVVDLQAVERMRDRIDGVLARLGRGEDPAVLAGWAIGADVVRAGLAGGTAPDRAGLVSELAELTDRFGRLCDVLRRVALAVTGLAATLSLFQVVVPHAVPVTSAVLLLVLAATVVLGRDYTGATDLPGPV